MIHSSPAAVQEEEQEASSSSRKTIQASKVSVMSELKTKLSSNSSIKVVAAPSEPPPPPPPQPPRSEASSTCSLEEAQREIERLKTVNEKLGGELKGRKRKDDCFLHTFLFRFYFTFVFCIRPRQEQGST